MTSAARPRLSRRRSILGGTIFPALLLLPVASAGQDSSAEREASLFEAANISGSVRAGYWSSTRNLDPNDHVGAGMIWLKSTGQLSLPVSFSIEAWASLRGPAGDAEALGELREAFVELRTGSLDVRAGRQIIAWGRADGINPTDNLAGEDQTLLAPDDDDRRLGTAAVHASYYFGDTAVTAVWLPEFRGHRFPLPPAPGVAFARDHPSWPVTQWALRVEQTGRAVDWAVSYFRGYDLAPDLRVSAATASHDNDTTIVLSHHRVRVLGADMAANFGRFGFRAEGAYVDTDDRNASDPFVKNPFFFVVAGADRTFRAYLNVNVQYIHRFVRGDRPLLAALSPSQSVVAELQRVLSGQTHRVQHGASFRVAYKWLRETLEGECAAAGFVAPDGFVLRPKLTYAATDRWKVVAGAEMYRGQSRSVFGLMRPNSTVYVESRWSF